MKYLGLMVAAASLALGAPAFADPYTFTITGDYNATFTIDSNPTPDDYGSGQGFVLWDQPGFPDAQIGLADITFFNAAVGGGVEFDDFYGGTTLLSTDGPQLYTGDEGNPMFRLGTFELTEYNGPGHYVINIAAAGGGSPAPEPASWAMMLGGFGLIGGTMRSRRKSAVSFG